LPEEAGTEQVENQELDKELLTGEAKAEKTDKQVNRVGDRMARSRQRLALNNDPGKTTQIIQDRILQDMDILIEQARRQMAQARNAKPQEGDPQQAQSKPNNQQANNQAAQQQPGSTTPAQTSRNTGGVATSAQPGKDLKGDGQEWGQISPRLRDAVMEGANDQMIEEYRKLIEDYKQAVATKATEH